MLLPNWLLVGIAHASLFMEYFTVTKDGVLDSNKALLAEQCGVSLAVFLAVLANKYVALQQQLPPGLAFNTFGD